MSERKMATVRRIDAIEQIEGADAIEVAVIGGWRVVVKKGEYTPGQLAVYCEIDSWVPTTIAPFLTREGHYPKEYKGVQGERLRTKKLRGVISQGLLLPLFSEGAIEGDDVSEQLGIQKWEPPEEFRSADAKGVFPHFLRKTDQERCQNLKRTIEDAYDDVLLFEVTEKLDGSSMTVYFHEDQVGVCSRNLDLKESEDNTFWKTAHASGAIKELELYCRLTERQLALQGELVGPGIQQNKYGLREHAYFIYDIFDIDKQKYLLPSQVYEIMNILRLKHVPVLHFSTDLRSPEISEMLEDAEDKSVLNAKTEREGVVYKCLDRDLSWKAISQKWLLKHE